MYKQKYIPQILEYTMTTPDVNEAFIALVLQSPPNPGSPRQIDRKYAQNTVGIELDRLIEKIIDKESCKVIDKAIDRVVIK